MANKTRIANYLSFPKRLKCAVYLLIFKGYQVNWETGKVERFKGGRK